MLFTVCFGVGKRSVVDFSRHILLTKDKTQHRMMHNTSTVFSASIVDSGKEKGKERFTAAVTVLMATTIYLLFHGLRATFCLLVFLLLCCYYYSFSLARGRNTSSGRQRTTGLDSQAGHAPPLAAI